MPVHVVLGSGECAKIKTRSNHLVGTEGQPIAEKTKSGWFGMSPGVELDQNTMLLTQASQRDYEELCRPDVLELADTIDRQTAGMRQVFHGAETIPLYHQTKSEASDDWKPAAKRINQRLQLCDLGAETARCCCTSYQSSKW